MSVSAYSSSLSTSDATMKKLKLKQEKEEVEGMERLVKKYKERISSLPMTNFLNTYLYNYQGFWYFSGFGCSVEGVMESQDSFVARSTDVVLATIPKSGTTWLKALALAIVTRAKYKNDSFGSHPLLIGNPHDYVPFIEGQLIFRENHASYDIETTDPRLLATHVPYVALPESVRGAGCRIVYVCRDPKDVFISSWFFNKKFEHIFPDKNMTFEEALDMFCKGISLNGSYWDHVLGYYKASLEQPDKVLFLKYEEMKKETVSLVKRLAEFLSQPFTNEEEVEGAAEVIVQLCSFEKMKNLEVNKTGVYRNNCGNQTFFREGKVGDFANHLTSEMIKSIDKITQDKFCGYDLSF